MKFFVLKAFIRWMFKSLFENIGLTHRKFRRTMEDEFFLAFLLWALFTGLFSIPVGVISMYLVPVDQMYLMSYIMTAYIATSVGYFVYTGFSIMYANFREEQERLLQTLKQ